MQFDNIIDFEKWKKFIEEKCVPKKPTTGRVFEEHVRDDIGFSSEKKPKK